MVLLHRTLTTLSGSQHFYDCLFIINFDLDQYGAVWPSPLSICLCTAWILVDYDIPEARVKAGFGC